MIVKNVEKRENSLVSFDVEVDAKEFEAAVQSAYLKSRGKIAVPGFRKGKAPRMVIEGMYGADVFYDDAINELAIQAFDQGAVEHSLKTIGSPSMTKADVNDDKSLSLTFETAVYPEATLGQYKGLEAVREMDEVTDAAVDAELANVQKRNARTVTVDRPSKEGDTAVINFEGFLDGVAFEGGKGENYSLKLGSGSFVPGFEEQVVGLSAGEEKDLDITFPTDYHPDLAGKAVVFKVKVLEVKETELPALDDEFAKDVSAFDTLAEYRADVKAGLVKAAEEKADANFKNNLMEKAIANMQVEIPEAMIEDNIDSMLREFEQNLTAQGIKVEQYLSMVGGDMVSLRRSYRPSALAGCQSELLLNAIVKAENIEVSDEEMEKEYQRIAELYGAELEVAKKAVPENVIRWNVSLSKAAEVVYSTGIPVAAEAEAQAEKKPAAKKTAAKKTAKAAEETAEAEEKPAKKPAAKKTAKKAEAEDAAEEKPAKKPAAKKTAKKAEAEGEAEAKPKKTTKKAAPKAE